MELLKEDVLPVVLVIVKSVVTVVEPLEEDVLPGVPVVVVSVVPVVETLEEKVLPVVVCYKSKMFLLIL